LFRSPARAARRARPDPGARHHRARPGGHRRVRAELPRDGPGAAGARVGGDALRGPRLPAGRLVGGAVPRHRHHPGRRVPDRRRAVSAASLRGEDAMTELAVTRVTGSTAHNPLVAVEDLRVSFPRAGVEAVRGVSLTIAPGECVALVGESGSGKSVTARSLLGLAGPGAVVRAARFEIGGRDARAFTARDWRQLRGRFAG